MATIATLGPKGWISEGHALLDQVMAWAYASDASQSLYFKDEVFSIQKVIAADVNGKLEMTASSLKSALIDYLSRFFTEVEVEVSIIEKDFKDHHLRGELILRATMVDSNGKELQLHEVMTNNGSAVRKVLDYEPF